MGILRNYPKYEPIKVFWTIPGGNAKRIFVFVGEQSKEVKEILKRGTDRNKKDNEILEKTFGSRWKHILGLEKIQVGGGRKSRANTKVSRGGSSKNDRRLKKIVQRGVGTEEDIPTYIDNTEEELLKVLEEMEKESVEEESRKIEELRSTEPEVRISISGVAVQYVFDYINKDDNVNTIKKKIFIWSKVPIIEQHIFYIRDSKIFEGEKEVVSMQYDIVEENKKGEVYPVNILNVKEIDVDNKFIKEFEGLRVLSIQDLGNMLLNEFEDFDGNLYFSSLNDFISDIGVRENLLGNSEEVYKGFIIKYFPGISQDSFREILERKYLSPEKIGTLERDLGDIQKQINLIHEIDVKVLQEKKMKILTLILKVNFDSISKFTGRILDARNLFDAFEVNDTVPYIKFKDTEKVYHKVQKLFYNEHLTLVEKKWKSTEPLLLSFRMKVKGAYSSVNIFDDGRFEVKTSWPEAEGMSFEESLGVGDVLKGVVGYINNLEAGVFIGQFRIPNPTFQVSGINIVGELDIDAIDYKDLSLLSKIFNGYLVIDTEKRVETVFSVYYRYLRTSVEFRKGAKLRRETRNEVLFSEEFPESGIIQDPLGKTIKGIDVHIAGQWSPKLFISGSKSIKEMENVYNFMIRFLYVYKNLNKFKSINDRWKNISDIIKKKSSGEREERDVKRVRKLQHVDPMLFDFEKKGKVEFYSRLCQSAQQPLPLGDDELREVKNDYEEVLRYGNKTYPGQFVNYVCPDHVYQFPGFLPKEKHPKGFCLPCCYKTSSQKTKSRKHKIFKECMRIELGKELTSEDDPAREESNRRYIKNWGKPIQEGRLGLIPHKLSALFNKKDCKISKLNMLERNSKCFLVFGINQDESSFITCISTALVGGKNVISTTSQREKILTFMDQTIKYLQKNKRIFDILENGEVKREFGTLDVFIEYLETGGGGSGISDKYVLDLFSNFNIYRPEGINIVVFTENPDTGNVSISCSGRTYGLLESFDDASRQTVVLIKSGKYYFPVFEISTDNSAMAVISVRRTFNKDSTIVKVIVQMYEHLCDIGSREDKFIEFKKRFGVELMPNSNDIEEVIKKNKGYEITSQVLKGNVLQFLNIKSPEGSIFSFPISAGSPGDWKSGKIEDGTARNVKRFIELLGKVYGTQILKSVVKDNHIIGYFLNTNYFVWIKNEKINNEYPQMVLKHDISTINKYIESGEQFPDERVEAMKRINLNLDTYKVMVLEISEYLFRQRNREIRKKIEGILDRYPGNSIDDYKNIKDKLFALSIGSNDLFKLDNVIRQMFVDDALGEKLFEETTFEFDGIYKKEIENNLENERVIRQIIGKIVDEVSLVKSGENRETVRGDNVLDTCSRKNKTGCSILPTCIWDSKGNCKVLIDSSHQKKELIARISEEIVKNDIIRGSILDHRVDTRIDPNKFISRVSEKIMITPLRSQS